MAELAPSPTRGSDLQIIADYDLQNGGKVCLALGDIVTYAPEQGGAIVNAANRGCQGGGGVDGAITRAGGEELRKLRRRLPKPFPGVDDRCETGDAVRTTAPEGTSLGRLNVKTVIHAVGPDYAEKNMSHAESDGLLRKAYGAAIREAGAAKVETVAFPLISAKIFRGNRDLGGLLELSLDALVTAADASSLKEVVLVAFSSRESDALLAAAWRAKTLQKRPRTAYAPRARQTPKKAKAAVDVDLTSDTSEGGASPRAKKSLDPVDLTNDDGAAAKRKAPDAPASLDLTIDDDDAAASAPQTAKKPRTKDGDAATPIDVEALELVVDLTEDNGEDDDDDDVQIIERPRDHAKKLQRQLNRFKGRSGGRARSLNEIMRDHERRKSGVIDVDDVDDDAALAQALQAREDTFESDRALARKLEAELNGGPVRMAPSKRKAAPDTSGDAALARRLAEKDRKGRPGQTPSWVGKAKPKDRSPATPEGWAVDDSGLLDVLADQRKSIRSWLATNASGLHIAACDANPHSMPGKPLYNRFVESWQRVPDQTVKLCFHGTAEANIDAICRDGLDPKRRSGQAYGPGEYFGAPGNAAISVGYCKGGRKMLVFAVLVDKSGLTLDNGSIIVVNKPEYQLPLFVLTFAAGGAAAPAMAPPMPAPIPGASPFALNGVASVQAYQAQLAAQRQAQLAQLQAQRQAQLAQMLAQRQALLAQLQGGGFPGGFPW
uniref:Macro domain-containing protein n=1 Tax=Pelagomonas calceolata TaxID=35677 RepID=A0A7S4A0C8_9STRA|mmetsp:Transcript_11321/g.34936  ORF Transcript_11321/g.34936 Transcript_11321/m.34936 type:complete len:719 (+) Transcript_11321:243-2399(+)